jgi:Tfp pilus assembly protein PilO
MSNRLWVLGTVLVSIALVVLGWFLGISPKLNEADAASAERASVDSQNLAQEAAIALLKDQFADLSTLKADLKKIQSAIPSSVSADTFFDQIVSAAASSGVLLDNITPLEAAAYGGSVDPTAAADPNAVQPETPTDPTLPVANLDASLTGRLFTAGVSIKVLGSADQVYAFTEALQKGARIFLLTDVNFTTDADQGATLTGFIFVVTDTAAAATPQ